MADDITLTVRVRDMSHGELSRLQGQLNRLRTNLQGVNRTTASQGQNARLAGRDLAQLSSRLRTLQRTGSVTRRELGMMNNQLTLAARSFRNAARAGEITSQALRNANRDIDVMRSRLVLLGRDGNVFTRLTARLRIFGDSVRHVDNHTSRLGRAMNRIGAGPAIGGLARMTAGLAVMLAMLGRMGHALNMNKRWTMILIAALALLGPAAAALGALLVTVLGGAFIALGAFALKGNEQVRSAFTAMKDTVAASVRQAAVPMQTELVRGINAVGVAALEMQPALTQAFAATAPLVQNFVGAITGLASGMLPGIVQALQQMGPAMEGFRSAMTMVGEGIGGMFAAMTAGGGAEALKDVWLTLGVELKNLLVGIGEFINMATQSGTATLLLVGVFRALSGALNLVQFGLEAIDTLFGGLPGTVAEAVTGIGDLGAAIGKAGDGFVNTHKPLDELKSDLASVNEEIKKAQDFEKAYRYVPEQTKHYAREHEGVGDLDSLLKKRQELTGAIAAAEREAAGSTAQHDAAVRSLAQSIRDLNQANLERFDAQAAQETAIANAKKGLEDLGGQVRIQNGMFELSHEPSRKFYENMSKIASSTKQAADDAENAHAPLNEINAIWSRGATELAALGAAAKLPKAEVQAFIDTVLMTPERKKTILEVEHQQAVAAANEARERINKVPKALKSQVTLEAQRAMERASMYKSQLDALNGKTAHTYIVNTTLNRILTETRYKSVHDIVGATGGLFTGRSFKHGYADGGPVRGPGSGTSDDVFAPWLSNGEFVIRAASVQKYGEAFLDALNQGKLKLGPGMAKGGKVKKKGGLNQDAAELLGSMNISSLWKQAGTKLSPFRKSLAQPGDVSSLIQTINNWRDKIKKATSGATEKRLVHAIGKTGAFLIKHQTALSKVTKAIDAAKDKLNDLKDKAAQLKEQVASGIIGSGNITGGVESGRPTSVGNIMANLQTKQRRAAEFASMLASLKGRGLGGQAISEIAQAGVDGGGFETAKALMKASSGTLKQINEQQKQIAASAAAAGKTAADAMYAAGIKAAEGLVKTLQKQASKIAASMMNAVVALEKAIKRALGKKATGGVIGAAGGGPRSKMTLVGEHGPEIVNLAAGSMVRSNPDSRRLAASMLGGGGQPIEVIVQLDGRTIARQIVDPLRAEIWHRTGGNVQKALGRGAVSA